SAGFRQGDEKKTETLDFKIYDQSSDASGLQLSQLQWVIAKDAGVWRIQQSANITNTKDTVVIVPPSVPAPIQIALAPGHGKLDTAFGRLPEAVKEVGDRLEVRGPVLPGEQGQGIQIEYDVEPSDGGDLSTTIAIPTSVSDLAVYVQDFGIDV